MSSEIAVYGWGYQEGGGVSVNELYTAPSMGGRKKQTSKKSLRYSTYCTFTSRRVGTDKMYEFTIVQLRIRPLTLSDLGGAC